MTQEQPLYVFEKEVQKDSIYGAFFPEERAIRAMLWIYGRIKTGAFPGERFTEASIYEAFQETSPEPYQRIPVGSFNTLIANLQQYYLRYDEDQQIYTFRDFGKNIFSLVEITLNGSFNPTEIEIICTKLKEDLLQCKNSAELEVWLQLNFKAFEPKMNTQVDNLDRYIDTTVATIRGLAQLQEGDVLEIVKDIDYQFGKVREYNGELKAAFSAMKEINQELQKLINDIETPQLLDSLDHVRQFFPHIKYRLDLIDKRLDRLQPRLRQFFSALNKPLFNARFEKFLRIVLSESQLEGTQKSIVFPMNMPSLKIFQSTSAFIIVSRKDDLFPPMARKRAGTDESEKDLQSVHLGLNQKVIMERNIERYVKMILDDCREKKEILFSPYFFKIIEEESLGLAVRVAHRLVQKLPYRRDFRVAVDNSNQIMKKGVSIWEMKIMN